MAMDYDMTRRSPNFNQRPGPPIAILLHSGEGTRASDLATLCTPRLDASQRWGTPNDPRVSAHFYVYRDGHSSELASPRLVLDREPNAAANEIGPLELADADYIWLYYQFVEGHASSVASFR